MASDTKNELLLLSISLTGKAAHARDDKIELFNNRLFPIPWPIDLSTLVAPVLLVVVVFQHHRLCFIRPHWLWLRASQEVSFYLVSIDKYEATSVIPSPCSEEIGIASPKPQREISARLSSIMRLSVEAQQSPSSLFGSRTRSRCCFSSSGESFDKWMIFQSHRIVLARTDVTPILASNKSNTRSDLPSASIFCRIMVPSIPFFLSMKSLQNKECNDVFKHFYKPFRTNDSTYRMQHPISLHWRQPYPPNET